MSILYKYHISRRIFSYYKWLFISLVSILYKYHISPIELNKLGHTTCSCRSFISIIFPIMKQIGCKRRLNLLCRSFISIIFPWFQTSSKHKGGCECRSFISIIFPLDDNRAISIEEVGVDPL